MDSRLAVVFAALLMSTAAGMLHIMFSSAQTSNILVHAQSYIIILGCLYLPKECTTKHFFTCYCCTVCTSHRLIPQKSGVGHGVFHAQLRGNDVY